MVCFPEVILTFLLPFDQKWFALINMRKELKDVIIYGLCIPCGIYAIYEGIKLMSYINYIKEHNAECYAPNPYRIEIFFGTIVVLAVL